MIKAGRGGFDTEKSLETLRKMRVNMLFVIGGDGTLSAAHQLFEAAREANANVSIVGVPKSIDNDVLFFDRTFGFDSAVACASGIIKNGWVEATSCAKGVGIVKLMGRDAGFVAAHASLASGLADMCLVPEVSFRLEDLLAHVETTLKRKGHMVIVVAEGAGQELIAGSNDEHDATGHKKCTLRIRVWSDVGIPRLIGASPQHLTTVCSSADRHAPRFRTLVRVVWSRRRYRHVPARHAELAPEIDGRPLLLHRPQLHHPLLPCGAERPHLLHAPRH